MSGQRDTSERDMSGQEPIDAEQVDPEHAKSELAGETPPHPDAEEMESALRQGGPLWKESEAEQAARRKQPTEPGPGTSLT